MCVYEILSAFDLKQSVHAQICIRMYQGGQMFYEIR